MELLSFCAVLSLFVVGAAFALHCVIAAYEEESRRQREVQAEFLREV